jgi:hypothetical protein
MKHYIFYVLIPVLVIFFLLGMNTSEPAFASAGNYSLRFYGNGSGDIDRVKIKLDAPAVPADVGGNFTIEFWMKASLSQNSSPACKSGGDNWILGNVIIDRDIYGDGDYGDYGISISKGRVAFGVSRGTNKHTLCGGIRVANGKWNHIAVTRNSKTGTMRIFVNGKLDASAVGPKGNISYRNGRSTSYPISDPYLVFGAEKHDAGAGYPSYNGFMDEVRISKIIRYKSDFTVVKKPFNSDKYTVALYRFNEGPAGACTGVIKDAKGKSHGQCMYGGSPSSGPVYSTQSPFP